MPKPRAIQPVGTSEAKHIFWGLYGPSSGGKTTFIATYPKTLIIRPPIEHTESVKNPAPGVEEWMVRSWDEMNDEVIDYLSHEGHNHAFVWLDSGSGWQDVGLDDVWKDLITRHPHRKKTPVDKGEYNANMVRLARWMREVVSMDQFNFGFTAWPEELEDAETGETKLMPWIQGKNMPNRMVGMMKLVTYLEKVDRKDKPPVRVMRYAEGVEGTKNKYIKDQYHLEGEKMVNPTMPKMMELIEAARAQKKAAARKTSGAKRPVKKTVRRRPRRS